MTDAVILQANATSSERRLSTLTLVPWYVWCTLAGITSVMIGVQWNISWHISIGRDTFWTPAHIAIYMCGVLAGAAYGYLILKTTFSAAATSLRAASVKILGLRGPLGAFIAGAAFVKTDFTTFAHIHPDGSVNMSAYMIAQQETLESSIASKERSNTKMPYMDDMTGMHAVSEMQMDMTDRNAPPVSNVLPNEVSFPYGFPQPGHYRIFVQVRKGQTIETGAFDASVQ